MPRCSLQLGTQYVLQTTHLSNRLLQLRVPIQAPHLTAKISCR